MIITEYSTKAIYWALTPVTRIKEKITAIFDSIVGVENNQEQLIHHITEELPPFEAIPVEPKITPPPPAAPLKESPTKTEAGSYSETGDLFYLFEME